MRMEFVTFVVAENKQIRLAGPKLESAGLVCTKLVIYNVGDRRGILNIEY